MATPQENLARFQEISNRGLQDRLKPDMRARFDEALNRGLITQQQVEQPPQEEAPSIQQQVSERLPSSPFLGTDVAAPIEAEEQTRAERELPELGSGGLLAGEDKFALAKVAPAILVTTKPQEIADILTANFDNIGIQSDEKGNLIAANNKTGARVVINKPGISKIDVLQGLGLMAAFAGPGKLAAIPAKLGAKAAAGAGAAGLTQAAIEGIQASIGGELNEEEIALAATFGGVAEAAIPAIQALRQSRSAGQQAKQLGVAKKELAETVEGIQPAQEAIAGLEKATGQKVGLFQAQQTQQPSTLVKQRFLPQLDASSRKAAKALENQNKEVFEATTELINRVAPEGALETGAERFRAASQIALDSAKARRSEATRELFEDALGTGAKTDLTPVNKTINELLTDAPKGGKFANRFNKIKSLIGKDPSLRKLQKVRFEIDDMLEARGDNALSNTLKRDVLEIRRSLTAQMEEASPLFKEANEEFSRLSPEVTKLQDSIVGKLAGVDDITLDSLSQRIFGGTKVSPQNIQAARKIIEKSDPGAWDDIMRVELQRRIGGIESRLDDQTGELIGNVPGQLKRAIFGNDTQRKALLTGMTTPQRQNFLYLEDVLKRAESGRAAGSPTAPFQQVARELRGPVRVFVDAILKPKETFLKTGDDALLNLNASKMADVLFNPKWEPKLKEIRKLNPLSEKAGRIFKEIFDAAKPAVQVQQTEAARQEVTQ